ncbi:MAG: hypothetical protein ACREC6_15115 [Hyphomicrobiaceae bacterium]
MTPTVTSEARIAAFLQALTEDCEAAYLAETFTDDEATAVEHTMNTVAGWLDAYEKSPHDRRYVTFIEGELQALVASLPEVATRFQQKGEHAILGGEDTGNKDREAEPPPPPTPAELKAPFVSARKHCQEADRKRRARKSG